MGEDAIPPDCDPATAAIIRAVRPFTLTSPERVIALCDAIDYLEAAQIRGAIVECGVWRGGSMMAAAMRLLERGSRERELFMFDTYDLEQIPMPGPHDVDLRGRPLSETFEAGISDPGIYATFTEERIRELFASTSYPEEKVITVKGQVGDTIPARAPEAIALCRLDTDYYESTAHELEHLFPRIVPGGVLIVDDYGEFPGCRKAVDEYLAANGLPLLLTRVDASGRVAVLPGR